jgi:3-methylcrotonyl-CoA carboxylase alpha subunit
MIDGAAADPSARAFVDGDAVYVSRKARQTIVRVRLATAEGVEEAKAGGRLRAPMHGKVLALLVEKGASVKKGQRVAVVEAMKMEHALVAPFDGRVVDIAVAVGAQVAEKAPIMTIEPQP